MEKLYYSMIYLISCEVNQIKPEKKYIEDIDMEKLYHFCKLHFLEVLVGTALKNAGFVLSDKWNQKLAKSIRKNILFDSERTKLFDFMEREQIWHIPLKGAVLKEYYPAVGMRQMTDNDILFDEKYSRKVQEYMESQGYVGENIGKGTHDVYKKKPVFNFELHRTLFNESVQGNMFRYYKNIKSRLLKNDNSECEYHFSREDFYIYILAHAYKHYQKGGTGIRSLLDFYMYLSVEEKNMDFEYIQRECECLEIADFEFANRVLCKKVFGKDISTDFDKFVNSLSEGEIEMLEYYFSSGVHGTMERGIKNRADNFSRENGNTSKFKYLLNRIFPSADKYKSDYPFFYKHKWLLPIGWIYRLLHMIFSKKKRKAALKEIQFLKKI